jgi:hypothetical protein
MGDIALRGNKLTKGPHGHGPKPFLNRPGQAQGTHGGKATGGRVGKFGGGRTRLLEELGRVEAEPSNRNRRAEIARVHGELNRGYKDGGRTNLLEELGRVEAEPSNRNRRAEISRVHSELNKGYATGGRVGLKKGGKSDKNWIQKVNKSIKKRGTKGKCTPLAKTFKKMAAKRKAKG